MRLSRGLLAVCLAALLCACAHASPGAHPPATSRPPIAEAPPPGTPDAPETPPAPEGSASDSAAALTASGPDCPPLANARTAALIAEHVAGGAPSDGELLVRRAYITEYDAVRRVPRWAAWRYTKDYAGPPPRTGRWSRFRADSDVEASVARGDYRHSGYDRGHIAPYFIAGGDRDGDGLGAADESLDVLDLEDACTVFEINTMTNIAPQLPALNRAGGAWYALETRIRGLVGEDASLRMIAGPVLGDAPTRIGPEGDIAVPARFFQIVVTDANEAVAFLFPNTEDSGGHERDCRPTSDPELCITSIDVIEALTGLDFFSTSSAEVQRALESEPNAELWRVLTGPGA